MGSLSRVSAIAMNTVREAVRDRLLYALLFFAVPLKYLGDLPLAVHVVGPIHGTLFAWLSLLVVGGLTSRDRPMSWGVRIMVAALLPFGIFVIDGRLRAEVNAEGRETINGGEPPYCAD